MTHNPEYDPTEPTLLSEQREAYESEKRDFLLWLDEKQTALQSWYNDIQNQIDLQRSWAKHPGPQSNDWQDYLEARKILSEHKDKLNVGLFYYDEDHS